MFGNVSSLVCSWQIIYWSGCRNFCSRREETPPLHSVLTMVPALPIDKISFRWINSEISNRQILSYIVSARPFSTEMYPIYPYPGYFNGFICSTVITLRRLSFWTNVLIKCTVSWCRPNFRTNSTDFTMINNFRCIILWDDTDVLWCGWNDRCSRDIGNTIMVQSSDYSGKRFCKWQKQC